MAKKYDSLAHTKYYTRYHIVFTPKYRRKVIYNQLRKDIAGYFKKLCKYKGVEIIEGHMMADHVHAVHPITEEEMHKIEKIHGTLLLIGAEDDVLWDMAKYI